MAAQIYAKVASLTGEAYARNAAGQLRLLKVGDIIREGESVITTDGSQVVLQLADGRQMALVPGDVVRIDAEVAADFKPDATDSAVASGHQTLNHVSEALARGENLDDMLDPTAAGNVGPANQGHSFVELARIVENVTPLAYAYATERGSVQGEFDGGRVLPASTNVQTDNTSPVEPQPPEPPKPVDPEPPEPPKPVDPEPPQPENHIPGITIDPNDPRDTPSDPKNPNVAATGMVNEAGLPDGTTPSLAIRTTSGTLHIDSGDGIQSVSINGTDVTAGGQITTPFGTLTIAVAGGQYSYTYVLNHNSTAHNTQGPNIDNVKDSFTVTVTDKDGDTASGKLNVSVVDDVPTARDDNFTGQHGSMVTGNVLLNNGHGADTFGADGQGGDVTLVAGSLTGGSGTLAFSPDGGFSYMPNYNDSNVVKFQYQIRDGDGDISTATVTITLNDTQQPPPPPVNHPPIAVNDHNSGLMDTTLTGNVLANDHDPDGDPLTVTGFTIGGTNYAPGDTATIAGVGDLTLNADGSYTFVPETGYVGPVPNVNYQISDGQGGSANANLILEMTATPPPDSAFIHTSGGTDITIPDSTVYERGLTSVADTSETTTGTFTIGATDGIANLVFSGLPGADVTVTLAQLNNLAATPQVIHTDVGTLTLTGYNAVTGAVNYSYTVNTAIDNASHPGATDTHYDDNMTVTVNGTSGTTANDVLTIRVIDDTPTANPDGPYVVTEAAPVNVVSGNVLANDSAGADGLAPIPVSWAADAAVKAELAQYGTLVQNNDGSWSFTLDNSLAATQALTAADLKEFVLHYTMMDGDGDTSSSTLTIKIQGTDEAPHLVPDVPDLALDVNVVYEDRTGMGAGPDGNVLANDTNAGTVASFKVVDFDGSLKAYVAGDSAAVYDPVTHSKIGDLTLNSNGDYTFTPILDYSGPVPQVIYTTSTGDSTTLDIAVKPVADVPTVAIELGTPTPAGYSTITLNSDFVAVPGNPNNLNLKLPTNPEYTITAWNADGTAGQFGQAVGGFGVGWYGQAAQGNIGAAAAEIAYRPDLGASEKLVVTFTHPVSTVTAVLTYLNANEHALLTAYDKDGNIVAQKLVYGQGDTAQTPTTLEVEVGSQPIARIEFTAPGGNGLGEWDDYMIKSITYENMVIVPIINLTVAPTDTDYSEQVTSINVAVSDPSAVLSVGSHHLVSGVWDGTWDLPLADNGAYHCTIDPTTGQVSITGLEVWLPPGTLSNAISVTAVATVTDSATIDGVTIYDSTTGSASDTAHVVLPAPEITTPPGLASDDLVIGTSNNDHLLGGAGNDTLVGLSGNDTLDGGPGNDILDGGPGNDLLIGGPGNDIMTGGSGADTFQWNLGDQGAKANPAIDKILDFDNASPANGGDILDLKDLLVGEHAVVGGGNLVNYLHFEYTGGNTIIHISTDGGFSTAASHNVGVAASIWNLQADQRIILQDTNIIGGHTTDAQVIQDLLNNGKLIVDN